MALPDQMHPCWQKLANGALPRIKTQHLGMQLMTKRIERSTDPVPSKAREIREFFAKWEATLGSEIQQLSSV